MKIIDCRGIPCPQPIIKTKEEIEKGFSDLQIIVDNIPATENVTRFLKKNGFECTVEKSKKDYFIIDAKNNSMLDIVSDFSDSSNTIKPIEESPCRTLIFLTSNTIGHGSEELGAKLMINFLATLPELGKRLWRIILLNGGVKLSAEEGPALQELKKLSSQGINILVCGTCLNYYGLLEKKQVGETTNMLDIITSLDLADKIIRP